MSDLLKALKQSPYKINFKFNGAKSRLDKAMECYKVRVCAQFFTLFSITVHF